jgi:hypothetical protein
MVTSRRHGLLLIFAICVQVLGSYVMTNAQADDPDSFPPVAPANERTVPADLSFVNVCIANSADIAAKGGWELGTQLLTQSDDWGTIWRADFKIPGSDLSPLVNRIICWKKGDKVNVMFAIGQSVVPL